jgi:predicted glutamine amidotransferase
MGLIGYNQYDLNDVVAVPTVNIGGLTTACMAGLQAQGAGGSYPYNNPDGWGIVEYEKKSKHLISYNDDSPGLMDGLIWRHMESAVGGGAVLFNDVEERLSNIDQNNEYRDLYPHIVLGHVRRATSGPTGIVDPHPFVFETPERDYSFIHNGGVKTEATHPNETNMEDLINAVDPNWLTEHPIQSGVDSEYFFSYIMYQITHNNNNIIEGLKLALHEMVSNNVIVLDSAINFILTDGVDLYAYRKMEAPETDNIHPLSYFYYREAPFSNYFAAVMSVFPNTLPSLCIQEIMDDELIYISKTGNIVKFKNFSEQGSEILTYVREFHEDVNWSSFPVMQGAETQITGFLAPLITDGGLHTLIYGENLPNEYVNNAWQDPNQMLNNGNLYKLDFAEDTTPFTSGGFHEQGTLRNSQVPVLTNIEPWQEYWIGYHLLPSQNIMEAFGANWEFVESVESENWYFTPMPVDPRKEPGDKEEGVPVFPPAWSIYNKNMDFGKGYVVTFNTSLPSFNWENPHHIDLDQLVALKPEKPELFNYTPLPKYIAIDIMDSDDPVNVLEIGAFQGVKCIGAIKPESLPCQLLAYPNWSDPTPITFEVVWKEAKSKTYVTQYKIWDKDVIDFIPGSITVSDNYYQVKMGNDSGNDNTQTPVITVQNAPNPFIDETSIIVKLTSDSNFSLTIYNVKGQKVVELFEGNRKAGKHAFLWDGRDEKGNRVSTGIYFSKIRNGNQAVINKMLVIK